jgi:transcriptional antiterminator RfaH
MMPASLRALLPDAKPLFPRYIFARFSVTRSLHKISFTRGVQRVVSFDEKPTPIDDEVIALLQARVDTDGFMRTGEPLRHGDKVRARMDHGKHLSV